VIEPELVSGRKRLRDVSNVQNRRFDRRKSDRENPKHRSGIVVTRHVEQDKDKTKKHPTGFRDSCCDLSVKYSIKSISSTTTNTVINHNHTGEQTYFTA